MGQDGVDVRMLGGFDVLVDGAPVAATWPGRRSAELFQLVALASGHRLTRDEVIEALWPHLPADAGAANLRKAAHHARRALGRPDAVVLRQGEVLLFPDLEVRTDVEAFTEGAEAALRDVDRIGANAVEPMYAGPLLPAARYEDWAETSRRLTAELHLDLLRLLKRWDAVVAEDPTDEAAARRAMLEHLHAGRRHRAISIYGRVRDALRDQLGVVADAATDVVYQRCISGLARDHAELFGRDRELAIIEAVLGQQAVGADVVVVRGEAGVGKSSIARALIERAAALGWATATVVSDQPADAYATVADLVEQLASVRPGVLGTLDAKSRSVLAMVVPVAGVVAAHGLPVTRHQMVGALQRLATVVAAGDALAVVVDDIDRVDPASLEVLSALADREIGRFVLCLTCHGSALHPALDRALARGRRGRPPVVIELGPLDDDSADALARATNGELDDAARGRVVARADGIPLVVVELATVGADGGVDSISGAVAARLVDVAEHEVARLRRLAIGEVGLDLDAVRALSGCNDDEADELLDHAIAAGVLVVEADRYRFRHDLVRVALAEQLPPHRRAAVHRDAARRCEELGVRPGRIATHWIAGRRPEQAAECLVRAAEDAIRLGGYATALELLDVALGFVAHHQRALRLRADALDAVGDWRALAAYDTAIATASQEDAHELRPLQALAQIKMGDPHGALVTLGDARPTTLPSQLAKALTFSGAALLGATTPEEGTRLSAEGRRLALRSGDPAALVVAAWSQAAVAHARGELRESLWADLTDTKALPLLAVTVFDGQLCITQRLLYGNRPYDDVIQFTNDFAAEAERLGAARGVAFATTLRGEAELLSGRLDVAARDLHEGARLHRAIAAPTGESFSFQRLSELAHIRGDDAEAHRLLDDALEVARSSDIGFHLLDRIYGTRIQLAADPHEALDAVIEAEDAVRGPFETCPGCRITLDVPAAIASARAGDLERVERYERSCEFLADVVMRLPAWDAALTEVRAHASQARGDMVQARRGFLTAAKQYSCAEHPVDADRCTAEAKATKV